MSAVALTLVGLVILVFAGDALVKGAVSLSLRLGVPALVVSLTIVGFGTSAPEMLIGVEAALYGSPGLAIGNVVGSNIANVFLVLGLPAVISTLATSQHDTRFSYVQMMGATVILIALVHLGPLHVWQGLLLLVLLALMLFSAYVAARRARANQAGGDLEGGDPSMPGWRIAAYLVAGLIGLPLGAGLLVDGATQIARGLGVSDAVIGLTLVALGTSLPELATTVMAALRKQADIAIGNVIGSNMFNILAILGVTSLVAPLTFEGRMLTVDVWVMLAASAALFPFVFLRFNMGRIIGAVFIAAYVVYTVSLF